MYPTNNETLGITDDQHSHDNWGPLTITLIPGVPPSGKFGAWGVDYFAQQAAENAARNLIAHHDDE